MSLIEGNAWAQMKAKEREKQLAGLDEEPLPPPSRPNTKPRTFSGLDYDAELALPMPKPRRRSPASDDTLTLTPSTPKPNVLTKPNVTKKRATTEPAHPAEASTSGSKANTEKKKSKVATLRSKFSLKDLGKDFRKEVPPLSSMPRLQGNEAVESSSNGEICLGHGQGQSSTFNDESLFVPKSRRGGDPPASAPLFQTSSFRDSLSIDRGSLESGTVQTPTQTDGSSEKTVKHRPVHSTNSGPSSANARLETLLLDGSSPPARTGECSNTGQPEVTQIQSRVCSMKAEDGSVMQSPQSAAPETPPRPIDAIEYSPSVYDTPKAVTSKPSDSSLRVKKDKKVEIPRPLIVSSDKKRQTPHEVPEGEVIISTAPKPRPCLPPKARSREGHQVQLPPIPVNNDNRYFAGVTSHGGFAPPPPHPGYQNTMALEQQFAAQVDSIHYHINTAMHKLSKTFENSNNWTMDQIMRQVESISDVSRLINSRTVTQTEIIKEMQRLIVDVRAQVTAAQRETRQSEERLKGFVHQEINKLREELGISLSNPGGSAQQNPKSSKNDSQGPQSAFKHPKATVENNRKGPNKRKPQTVKKEEAAVTPNKEKKRLTASTQEGKPPAPSSKPQNEKSTGTQPSDQEQSANIPTPTAAFRTPQVPQSEGDDIFTDTLTPKAKATPVSTSNLSMESSGSPEPKPSKLRNVMSLTQLPKLEDRRSLEKSQENRESENKPTGLNDEEIKTPQKKPSMFNFRRKRDGDNNLPGNRFLRTPRRTKERKSTSEQSPLLPPQELALIRTSSFSSSHPEHTSTNITAAAQISREPSPSSIHPALRNPRQCQIMLEREQAQAAVARRSTYRQPHSQRQTKTLRFSQSHQSFRSSTQPTPPSSSPPSSIAPSWPQEQQQHHAYGPNSPLFLIHHSPTASSSSSLRTLTQRQLTVHYPSPPLPAGGFHHAPQSFASMAPTDPGMWIPSRPPPPTPTQVPIHGQFRVDEGWYRDSYGYSIENGGQEGQPFPGGFI